VHQRGAIAVPGQAGTVGAMASKRHTRTARNRDRSSDQSTLSPYALRQRRRVRMVAIFTAAALLLPLVAALFTGGTP
jgi:hypothetical protein